MFIDPNKKPDAFFEDAEYQKDDNPIVGIVILSTVLCITLAGVCAFFFLVHP